MTKQIEKRLKYLVLAGAVMFVATSTISMLDMISRDELTWRFFPTLTVALLALCSAALGAWKNLPKNSFFSYFAAFTIVLQDREIGFGRIFVAFAILYLGLQLAKREKSPATSVSTETPEPTDTSKSPDTY